MQVIKHGYSIKSEVLEISSIKPGGTVNFQGKDYSASTKFRSVNVIEEPFENSFREVEEIVEYQVVCSSNQEAADVSNLLRNLRAKKLPVFVNSSIPRLYEKSQIYIAKSIDMGAAFLELNRTHDKKSQS